MALQYFVNSWIFGDCRIERIIERVSRIGYDGIELVGEPDIYDGRKIKELASSSGIKICSICGMFPGPDKHDLRALAHPEEEQRKKAIHYIERCIDLAVATNARSVLVVPGLVGRPEFFTSKQKMAKEINNPFVKIMGDTFHMQIEEADGIPEAIRRATGRWLYHLHAADNTREAPGRGTMNWRHIIRSLYDTNYTGVVSLEPLPKGASPYNARTGRIPEEKLDGELFFALSYLKLQEQIVKDLV